MYDMHCKMTKRGIDIRCLERGDMDLQLKTARQSISVKQGLESADAKKIVKLIKDEKLKVQASIQGDTVRVNGKKRDDLQTAIALIKEKDPVVCLCNIRISVTDQTRILADLGVTHLNGLVCLRFEIV